MSARNTYKIIIGWLNVDNEAVRQQLATDLAEHIATCAIGVSSVCLKSERPGETMAAGTIISFEMADKIARNLLEAIRSWLASRRTEVELQTPDGKKIKISASNFDETMRLLDTLL